MDRSDSIRRTLDIMSKHPSVCKVENPLFNERKNFITINVTFEVNLPNQWRQQGKSPSGVRLEEVVRFDFPAEFPMNPPELSLRSDFNSKLPHIQPWRVNKRLVPCIYDGPLPELLHKEGIAGILNHTAIWLKRSALNTLMDPEQGWEPVRRDSLHNARIIADAGYLQGLVNRQGGHLFLKSYVWVFNNNGIYCVYGWILNEKIQINSNSIIQLFDNHELLALIVWPGKDPSSGKLIINDTYLPENVDNVDSLKKRAEFYRCERELNDGLKWLGKCLLRYTLKKPFAMIVIFLARRPFKVIGSLSNIELCPYIVETSTHQFVNDKSTRVYPAAHYHNISRSLLAQMSGNKTPERPEWTLIGAGSLGSKIALHLARAGNGPNVVIDNSSMAPHNLSRHGLISVMKPKAQALVEALHSLDQKSTSIIENVTNILITKSQNSRAWSKHSWAVVNTTASLFVREALGVSNKLNSLRVIEASLFAGGLIGLITVEGTCRNPNTKNLIAEYYRLLKENPDLASIVFSHDNSASRQIIGQGCGSLTMVMSDSRLSLFAAGMSEYLLTKQHNGLPENNGEVLISQLSENGFGLKWRSWIIPPVTIVHTEQRNWCVHIHEHAVEKMRNEVSRWPDIETGGILMGMISETARIAYVVDILYPPEDSHRSNNEFTLGTKGVRQQIQKYSEAVNWSLYCIGTWHSHLSSSGPSAMDQATAKAVSLARLMPSIFLIMTPTKFYAFEAGTKNNGGGL